MPVNIKIINDPKNFITQSATQTELRALFTHSKTDFSRDRKLGFERLVLLLINFSVEVILLKSLNFITGWK